MSVKIPLHMMQAMTGYRAAGLTAKVIAGNKAASLITYKFSRTEARS